MSPLRNIARAYREAFSGLPREIWQLCLVALVNRAGTMVLPFFALFMTLDRGVSIIEAGRMVGVYGLGSFVGSYIGGVLSDRIGSIRVQQASLALGGVGYLTILQFHDPLALALVVFLTSVAAEAFRPAVMTSIAHRAPAGLESRSFALLRLAVNVGMGVGPAVGGLLATISYQFLFVLDAATSWASLVVLLVLIPGARRGDGEQPTVGATPARSPWTDGPFLGLMAIMTLLASCFFQIFATLPIYLKQSYGMRENTIGMVIGFNALLIVLFEMLLIHRCEGKDRLKVVGVGCLLVCAGLGLLPLGAGLIWAILTTVVWTFGEMLVLPMTNTAVASRADVANRGRYMGVYTMSFSFAFIVAPIAGTWVLDRLGGRVLWFGIAAMGLPLLLASFALSGSFRARAAEPEQSGP